MDLQSLSERSIAAFSFSIAFALSVLFQNPAVSVRRVSSASFASLTGVSKMPPQDFEPVLDLVDLLFQIFYQHEILLAAFLGMVSV